MITETKFVPPIGGVIADMQALEDVLKKKAIRSGLGAIAKPVNAAMKDLAPKKRADRIGRAVTTRQVSQRLGERLQLWNRSDDTITPGQVAVIVGPNKKVDGRLWTKLAAWHEFGTKPHTVKAKKRSRTGRRLLSVGKNQIASGSVRHPGMKAKEFMARALATVDGRADDLFYNGLARRLKTIRARTLT